MEKCQICGKGSDCKGMVYLATKENEQPKIMCRDCYNKYISDIFGIDDYIDFIKEAVFIDCDG
ncbi:MAG: hypothetical protein WBJ13_08490, partial [Sedimentibacter sp.]